MHDGRNNYVPKLLKQLERKSVCDTFGLRRRNRRRKAIGTKTYNNQS